MFWPEFVFAVLFFANARANLCYNTPGLTFPTITTPPTVSCSFPGQVCELCIVSSDQTYLQLCTSAAGCQADLSLSVTNPETSFCRQVVCCDTPLCNTAPGQPAPTDFPAPPSPTPSSARGWIDVAPFSWISLTCTAAVLSVLAI